MWKSQDYWVWKRGLLDLCDLQLSNSHISRFLHTNVVLEVNVRSTIFLSVFFNLDIHRESSWIFLDRPVQVADINYVGENVSCKYRVKRASSGVIWGSFGKNRGSQMSAEHPAEIVRSTSKTEAHAIFIRQAFPRKFHLETFAKHETLWVRSCLLTLLPVRDSCIRHGCWKTYWTLPLCDIVIIWTTYIHFNCKCIII